MTDGHPVAAGELFVQTDLARTLTTIAKDGADAFYRGALARKSADFYAAQGGLLSADDLAKYVAEQAEPIHTAYAGLDVYQSAPNSQGIVMLVALNILEGYDLEALGHNSVEYLHVVTEAMKLAFADRNRYVGDPRFVDVPTQALLSKDYASARRKLIRSDRAMVVVPPGDPRNGKALLGRRAAPRRSPNLLNKRTWTSCGITSAAGRAPCRRPTTRFPSIAQTLRRRTLPANRFIR